MVFICFIYERPLVRVQWLVLYEWAGHCVTAAWGGESAETAATCSTEDREAELQTAAVTSHTDTLDSRSQPLAKAVSGVRVLSEDTQSHLVTRVTNIDIQDWRTVISSSDLVTQSRGGNFSQVESESSRWVLQCYTQRMFKCGENIYSLEKCVTNDGCLSDQFLKTGMNWLTPSVKIWVFIFCIFNLPGHSVIAAGAWHRRNRCPAGDSGAGTDSRLVTRACHQLMSQVWPRLNSGAYIISQK